MTASPGPVLVYGANGYTAGLVLGELAARGVDFLVAGRNPQRVAAVARAFGVPARVFALDDPAALSAGLRGVRFLLNAAGPYSATAAPVMEACLRAGVHYLDLSGELGTFELAARRGAEARCRDVMLLPGIGFDVVPSDCLAVHLAGRLPGAERLVLEVFPSSFLSHGSALSFVEYFGKPVHVRRNGRLEPVRFRMPMRWARFGGTARPFIAVSWGDLVTAFHSTGIPNIEVYFEANTLRWLAVAANQFLGQSPYAPWLKPWMRSFADRLPAGPTRPEREREESIIVGEAQAGPRRIRVRLITPEAYTCTALTAAAALARVLQGDYRSGFQTPGALFGPDFVLSVPGVRLEDVSEQLT